MPERTKLEVYLFHHGVSCLHMTEAESDFVMRDGRAASWWQEPLLSKVIRDFQKHLGSQVPGSDGVLGSERKLVEIKGLAKTKLQFQDSCRKGSGRDCSQDELILDISNKAYYAIADMKESIWRIVLLPTTFFLPFAVANKLTPKGWTRKKFWSVLKEHFNLEEVSYNDLVASPE